MSDNWKFGLAIAAIATWFTFATVEDAAYAQKNETAVPKKQRAIALGETDVKDLLTLMDVDKNGKISKKEFMDFMEAEFNRLDVDKSGELDVKELTKSQVRPSPGAVGK